MRREPYILSIASTAIWAVALILVILVGLDFYVVSQGIGSLKLKARQKEKTIYLEAPVRNTGFLPLNLKVNLDFCNNNYYWSGELPPGSKRIVRFKVNLKDLSCKPKWKVVVDLGGIVSAVVLPAQG